MHCYYYSKLTITHLHWEYNLSNKKLECSWSATEIDGKQKRTVKGNK